MTLFVHKMWNYSQLLPQSFDKAIPYDECLETADSLDAIKGLKIAPGFTSKVKNILGESNRCLHLTTLLFAMAPAVMQGYKVFIGKNSSGGGIPTDVVENYLVDSCWVWRKEGHLAGRLKKNKNR